MVENQAALLLNMQRAPQLVGILTCPGPQGTHGYAAGGVWLVPPFLIYGQL